MKASREKGVFIYIKEDSKNIKKLLNKKKMDTLSQVVGAVLKTQKPYKNKG